MQKLILGGLSQHHIPFYAKINLNNEIIFENLM